MSASTGKTLPKERWNNAAENISQVAPLIAARLCKLNADGRGKEDAEEFMADMTLAYTALRYVAEFAADKCRFIPINASDMN